MDPPPTEVGVSLQPSSALGVAASFGVGNRAVLFPRALKKETTSASSSSSTLATSLSLVQWETSLYSGVGRKLINESAQVFLQLQQKAQQEETIGNAHLVRVSRQYRSILRDCQEQLDQESAASTPSSEEGQQQQQAELLYRLELIWNLVEILCIEKPANGVILPQLLQWVCLHFPQADERARAVLLENPERPEVHPDYWDAVLLYLMQGRLDQAQQMLRLHSEFEAGNSAFQSLDELVRKMPLYNAQQSFVDFAFRWKHWQREAVSRLDEGDFASDVNLTLLASLLAGSEATLSEVSSRCDTWYQWMIGRLLFTNPDVRSYELSGHAETAINKFGGLGQMTELDSILLATMEDDIAQVIHELVSTLDNFWFPAHLLDLLHHADQLDSPGRHRDRDREPGTAGTGHQPGQAPPLQPGPGLREFLLLEYASCLMSHRSLWQTGVLYLDHCPTQGLFRLELLLERVPVATERKANKVISIASERGLSGIVGSVCKVMGMRALKDSRIGSAMAWALKSQDVTFTTFLADRLLQQYSEEGSFQSSDLLDHLGSSMVLSDRLTFLAKYREFHQLCNDSEFAPAAKLLHSLMWSRLAPKYFWVTLLIDAVPFVCCSSQGGEVLLNSEQTYELLHCLQELSKDESLPKKQRALLDEHEPQIRMQLAKNLAVALMSEGDVDSNKGVAAAF